MLNTPSAPLQLNVINRESGQPVLYIGGDATLDIKLVNATGTEVTISATRPAAFTLFLPTFYSLADLQAMRFELAGLPGWAGACDAEQVALVLTYGGAPATWSPGTVLAFAISDVRCSATQADTNQTLQVSPSGIDGLPPQVEAPLPLIAAPKPGHLPLAEALHASLDNQGVVYVSNADDPLANHLTLTITNLGSASLYNDAMTPRPAAPAPKISVSFLYGSSGGALAPAGKQDGMLGSAWNIRVATTDSSGGEWIASDPPSPSTDSTPSWTLSPAPTNSVVLGSGSQANVAFTFSNIVSFLLPGHTQMVLHCTGFSRDKLTTYDEAVFFLDIVKQFPPPTRGLMSFYGPLPLQEVNRPDQSVTIPLFWTMTNVASVALISNQPGMPATRTSYKVPPPALAYDSTAVTLPGVNRTTTLMFTLQSFDAAGRYLNSLQFASQIQANMFLDPRDGTIYPAVRIGRRFWMAANLAYPAASGSWFAGGDGGALGRYYTVAASALSDPASGWRLPSAADWKDLVAAAGGSAAAYSVLAPKGRSGFAVQLGGFRDSMGSINELGQSGFYWTATPSDQPGTQQVAQFSAGRQTVTVGTGTGLPAGYGASVRYVRDA